MTLIWTAIALAAGSVVGVAARWGRMRVLVKSRNRAVVRAHAFEEENELLRAKLARLEALGVVEAPDSLHAKIDRGIIRGIAYIRDRELEANQ